MYEEYKCKTYENRMNTCFGGTEEREKSCAKREKEGNMAL